MAKQYLWTRRCSRIHCHGAFLKVSRILSASDVLISRLHRTAIRNSCKCGRTRDGVMVIEFCSKSQECVHEADATRIRKHYGTGRARSALCACSVVAIAPGVFDAGVSGVDVAANSGLRGEVWIRCGGIARLAWRYEFAGAAGICRGKDPDCQARRSGTRIEDRMRAQFGGDARRGPAKARATTFRCAQFYRSGVGVGRALRAGLWE